MFLKFFLVHELETLGILWREETREKGDREGETKRGQTWSYGGEQARHFSCTHLGEEALFGKNICGELMYFIIAIKDPFFPRIISSPHLVEWIRSAIYGALFTGLHLFKGIICKTIAWFLDQDYSYTFWRENEVQEEFSSQDR